MINVYAFHPALFFSLLCSLAGIGLVPAGHAEELVVTAEPDALREWLEETLVQREISLVDTAGTGNFSMLAAQSNTTRITVTLRSLPIQPGQPEAQEKTHVVIATDSPANQALEIALAQDIVAAVNTHAE